MAKAWPEAGEAFSKAVELHVKLGSTYDAANAAQEAANCFKNVRACTCALLGGDCSFVGSLACERPTDDRHPHRRRRLTTHTHTQRYGTRR